MKIVIAGGTGFLGNVLESYFISKNHEVVILTRRPRDKNHVKWDGRNLGEWTSAIENVDVIINLTGKSVDCRYTDKNKKEILDSRINSTSILQEALTLVKTPPRIWLNSSSATIYVHSENTEMTEKNGIIGNDFSMGVCKEWEKQFFKTNILSIRKVALRSAVVLGRAGGAFPKLKLISQLGFGGSQGKGAQYFSWIHEKDFCRAVEFIIENEEITGSVNIAGQKPVTNKVFMQLLSKHTRSLIRLSIPVWLFEIGAFILRTQTELLLKSRRVVPEILWQSGFQFEYQTLDGALNDLFINSKNGV